jgi:hypothetical protein
LKPWAIERMERNWPPTVEVAQCGRWSYLVSLVHGPHAESTGVLGRSRAERKARRVLTAYVAQCERERGWAFDAKTIGVER